MWTATAVHSVALFSKFREPCPALAAEWMRFLDTEGISSQALGNSARRHHVAVTGFCRARRPGCSWAQFHALVDYSRAPFAHLFDAERHTIGALPSAATTECRRLHRPTEEQLLELVSRSEPAVISGMLDDWPALELWDDAYLASKLGHLPVTISVSEGASSSQLITPQLRALTTRGRATC